MELDGTKIILDTIQNTVGYESKELSNAALIEIPDDILKSFYVSLSEEEKTSFANSIFAFWIYYKSLKPSENAKDVGEIWTNFIILILFALVERIMSEEEYVDCYAYLDSKKDSGRSINDLLNEWKSKYGSNQKIRLFFERYISEDERRAILNAINKDPKWNKIDSIEKFVSKILSLRHKFVHDLALESISALNVRGMFTDDDLDFQKMVWYPTISIDMLIHMILKGVFRIFDKNNILKTVL